MSLDDETAFLAELDAMLREPPEGADDDPELRELEGFAQSVRGRKTVRPGAPRKGNAR